jgi:glutamate-1-semialdehyde 2,1-aminomutase
VMSVGSIDRIGQERTFLLSSTHGGEMCSLAAFIETVRIYREQDVCGHLWSYGQRLRGALVDAAASTGMANRFSVDGPDISLGFSTRDADGQPSMPMRTLFCQEMVRNGVLMPWIAISQSHGDTELELTWKAARSAAGSMPASP